MLYYPGLMHGHRLLFPKISSGKMAVQDQQYLALCHDTSGFAKIDFLDDSNIRRTTLQLVLVLFQHLLLSHFLLRFLKHQYLMPLSALARIPKVTILIF